jgi:16S rRNA (adenine1518-N6/adenine1519-N6)-dimethyltransferase
MKLSEIKQTLAEHQLQLTKSLGQNFLHDANQLQRIVTAAELTPRDKVLEVGPGLGPLTELIAGKCEHVLAIEKDQRLFELLKQRLSSVSTLEIIHADALQYVRECRNWAEWKVVSNFPYSVASPVLVELAQAASSPRLIIATLQSEVGERIMAAPDTDHYGLLTLLLQLRYQPEKSFKIPRTCFFPEPEVDSSCIVLRLRSSPLLLPSVENVFIKIVKQAFSQRRKMMLKLLKQHWPEPQLSAAFGQAELSPKIRAEAVSLEQFVQLTQSLTGNSQT